jgi:hypothetical protein
MAPVLLTTNPSAEKFARGLESWDWLDLAGKTPVLASLFGDIFFAAADGYWFLSLMEGSLSPTGMTRDELQALLDTEDGQDQYLLGGLAMAAERSGLVLGSDEVYLFVVPPNLGGSFSVENMMKADFAVALHITAQVARAVKDLPPGASVDGFSVDGQTP